MKIIDYIQSLFVPYKVCVFNGAWSKIYALVVEKTPNDDWIAYYYTRKNDSMFANRICEVIAESKHKAMIAAYKCLKNEYRWLSTQ